LAGESNLIAFDSTQQAFRAEMLLEYADIDLSIEFPIADYGKARAIMGEQMKTIRDYFRQFSGRYQEVDMKMANGRGESDGEERLF